MNGENRISSLSKLQTLMHALVQKWAVLARGGRRQMDTFDEKSLMIR